MCLCHVSDEGRGVSEAAGPRQLARRAHWVWQHEAAWLAEAARAAAVMLESVAFDAVAAVVHDSSTELATLRPLQLVFLMILFFFAALRCSGGVRMLVSFLKYEQNVIFCKSAPIRRGKV